MMVQAGVDVYLDTLFLPNMTDSIWEIALIQSFLTIVDYGNDVDASIQKRQHCRRIASTL